MRPWDDGRRRRVAAELDALAAAGLARGARLWQAQLVTRRGVDPGLGGTVIAVAVPAEGPDDEARLDELERRLRAAAIAGAATQQPAPAVLFVDPAQAAGLRASLGRGLAARRFRRRTPPD
jgi:hypothetical protein